VLIDGVDVTDYKLDGLREQIGFVLQDTVLFVGTIRDNIAYGRTNATRTKSSRRRRWPTRTISSSLMPQGLRLARRRARPDAFRRPAPAHRHRARGRAQFADLILDEPTAALDTESEKVVMEALERLMQGRTCITIAHRLSTIRDSHKIVVLKGGVVAEEGTHAELIARNEIYAGLYRIQAGSTPMPDAPATVS
jgi:subfamily B ATP-binding cassette protein MsbA